MGVVRAVWRGLALSVNWRPVEGQILVVWLETEDALEVCVFVFVLCFVLILIFASYWCLDWNS